MRKTLNPFTLLYLTLALLGANCAGPQGSKLVLQGDQQMAVGNYSSAADQYRKVLVQDANDPPRLRLAMALIRSGRHTEALAELAKVKQDLHQSLYLKALCCVALNDVAQAEQFIEQALQEKPDDSRTLALLGRVKFLQKEYARSAEAYQNAVANSANDTVRTTLHYNLAMAQLLAGRFKQADDTFRLYLIKQKFITKEDNRLAGAIAYAAGDRERAFRHWKTLTSKEQQKILNALDDQPTQAAEVAMNNG
ncbi:MAG: tetratricopeptide repeat protein [Planctomycetes bacterium]|nr:tetratricopeptide repeat protein [Planctomycetota bacterium]